MRGYITSDLGVETITLGVQFHFFMWCVLALNLTQSQYMDVINSMQGNMSVQGVDTSG